MSHELNLPIRVILWAGNRPEDHDDHLHVEGIPKRGGTPPTKNPYPGGTPSIKIILAALEERFPGALWIDNDRTPNGQWSPAGPSTRGIYNRRYIAGTTTWTQHSWSNAVDIGWLYGVKGQQEVYDFLTGRERHVAYEEIAGYKFYDVANWPKWAEPNIRAAIADGVMIGKTFDAKDEKKRLFDAGGSVTRAELATTLKRIGALD